MESSLNDALRNGEKLRLIPASMLAVLKEEIGLFRRTERLNGFQTWITTGLYSFGIPETGFAVQSILLLAIPHPFSAKAEFMRNGKKYVFTSLVMSDFETAEENLRKAVLKEKFNLAPAPKLPLKRLAVRSGFAEYGRNNVCYISGMGSCFSFAAYFSDIPCDDDRHTGLNMASTCATCDACVRSCPTGALRKDVFLVDTDRCLSFMNESGEPFPPWLPDSAHHCVYDCLKCQVNCPMNRNLIRTEGKTIGFSDQETEVLVSGTRSERFSPSLLEKTRYLGLHQWPEGIAKNLKKLFELSDRTGGLEPGYRL